MKTIKIISVLILVLSIGVIPVPINAKSKPKSHSAETMLKEARRSVYRIFRDEEIRNFVNEDLKSTVFVTFKVDKNQQLKVVKIENGNEVLNSLIKSTVAKSNVVFDECCKYRYFRTPLTFVYQK
ncbi:hypothetical protein E9993_07240 [Labilibacter sediminis]|nr:hypothetical protein E9993_07240 [Labilibacter sediminis]